jgi:hypothetical protein
MARKKNTSGKRRTLKKTTRRTIDTSTKNRKRTAAKKKKKKKIAINIRRSSGRKEKFDVDRMTQTTSRSGVPFMMARDIAKNVSKEISSEAKDSNKDEKTVTAGRVRNMIAEELRNRNEQTKASSYAGEVPENTQNDGTALKIGGQYASPIGSADTDQHQAYRGDRDSVLHDKSKRQMSST